MFFRLRADAVRPRHATSIIWLALAAGCAAPPAAPYSDGAVLDSVDARDADLSLAQSVLKLADISPVDLALPDDRSQLEPSRAGFWRACAYAWNPGVRSARRQLLAASGRAQSAGSLEPLSLRLVDHEFGGEAALVESVATLDLISLLGAGPSRAERVEADASVLSAMGTLESELWSARFQVERARIGLAAARARLEEFAVLVAEVHSDLERLRILHEHGRIGDAQWASAAARAERLGRDLSLAREGEAAARLSLIVSSGLPEDHSALRAPGLSTLDVAIPSISAPPGEELLRSHPSLRLARLRLAQAEARIRVVAARAWPGLRLGPHVSWPGSGAHLGGVLQLSLPFPSEWRGELEAAQAERGRRLDQIEDAFLQHRSGLEVAFVRRAEARARERRHSPALHAASEDNWRATRARLRVGRCSVDEWARALDWRLANLTLLVDASAAERIAGLDLMELAGPAASLGAES